MLSWELLTPKPVSKLTHSFMENEERIQTLQRKIRTFERRL